MSLMGFYVSLMGLGIAVQWIELEIWCEMVYSPW
jgi:hypothetical protein